MKVTQWFSADVKPIHVGLYHRLKSDLQLDDGIWTGSHWVFPDDNRMSPGEPCGIQDCEWRGLAEKPKSK